MGHRRRQEAPNPRQIFAILHAYRTGMGAPEIAERTKHSPSSVKRWNVRYSEDYLWLLQLIQDVPGAFKTLSLDHVYALPYVPEHMGSLTSAQA